MAFRVFNVILGAGATRAIATHLPIAGLRIESETGNADVLFGGEDVAADNYAGTVTAGPTNAVSLDPTPQGLVNLDKIYFLGTADDIIHLTVVTP